MRISMQTKPMLQMIRGRRSTGRGSTRRPCVRVLHVYVCVLCILYYIISSYVRLYYIVLYGYYHYYQYLFIMIHQRGVQWETGCRGLHYIIGCFIAQCYAHPLHPPPTAPPFDEYLTVLCILYKLCVCMHIARGEHYISTCYAYNCVYIIMCMYIYIYMYIYVYIYIYTHTLYINFVARQYIYIYIYIHIHIYIYMHIYEYIYIYYDIL